MQSENLLNAANECIKSGNSCCPEGAVRSDQAMVKVGYMIAAGLFSIAGVLAQKNEKP